MTRLQLAAIAVASLLATIGVLSASSSGSPDLSQVAARQPVTVTVPAATQTAPSAPSVDPSPSRQASSSSPKSEPASEPSDDGTETTPTTAPAKTTPAAPVAPKPTQIKHVFVISLAGRGFDAAFGTTSQAPYLSGQLRPQGTLLENYRSLGKADLPDLLALIGGQPPNADTRAGCPAFTEIPPSAKVAKSGEVRASGCVFPNTVTTVADQLTAAGKTWRAYVEDIGPTACRRPGSNAPDDTLHARSGDGYATRHNPFVYYHSLVDLSDCDASDGPLERLETDLADARTTPNLSYVAPNLCHDGTESPCVDGSPGGLPAADAFLATWVPKILASPAFKADGVLIVSFHGNVAAAPGAPDGPARSGALVVSRFVQAGGTENDALDPYALLRSLEDAFGLKPLARAAKAPSLLDTVLKTARTPTAGDD